MKGFIKIHRSVDDHWIGATAAFAGAWQILLVKASWKDNIILYKGRPVKLKRGQLMASYRYLADRFDWSIGKTQRFIKLLVKEGMATRFTHDSGVQVITICEYDRFQAVELQADTPTDSPAIHQRYTNDTTLKKESKEEEDSHTTRELPTFGLMKECFKWENGQLWIEGVAEASRWVEIFGGNKQLAAALAGFTPDKEYKHGNSLDKHARHYLSGKAAHGNRTNFYPSHNTPRKSYREKLGGSA